MSIDSDFNKEMPSLEVGGNKGLINKDHDHSQAAAEPFKMPSDADFLKRLGIYTTFFAHKGSGECSLSEILYPPNNPK